jgi:O-methyltransferase involved in polyketide biosynthesis
LSRDRSALVYLFVDTRWLESIARNALIFFVALGVFYYIPDDLKTLLKGIADNISAGELLFDSCSTSGMRIANKRVIEAGGMSATAKLVWSLHDPREIACWDKRIALTV